MKNTNENELKAISTTGTKYSMEQLGIGQTRSEIVQKIADAPHAGIIFVKAYEGKNSYGEVANFVYLKGISYANMKSKSLSILDEMANNPELSVTARYNAWIDPQGNEHNRKAKDRSLSKIVRTYTQGHPALTEALNKVRQSILDPHTPHAEYDKLGNGIYEQDDGTLHIRDCLLVRKTVIKEGDYPVTASSEIVALTNAIKRDMPLSDYRQVRLDGRFDYIAIGGELIGQDEDGEWFETFSEYNGIVESHISPAESVEPVKTPKPVTAPVPEPVK